MKRVFKKWWKKAIYEIKSHPIIYFLLLIILIGALFVRVYRANDLLGFYYDQGRDALVIWRLWHEGKLFFDWTRYRLSRNFFWALCTII